MPDKLMDSEIVKACKDCKDCLHYEACKGTYSSAKGDADILYDFDGEMYANSGCEDFEDKDLINRLQKADEKNKDSIRLLQLAIDQKRRKILRLEEDNQDLQAENEEQEQATINVLHQIKDVRQTAKAEAYKEFAERLKKEIDRQPHSRSLEASGERFRIIKILDNLLKELVGEDK